ITWGSGSGFVRVQASNACGASGVQSQTFSSVTCREAGDESPVSDLKFDVYPNPAHDKITVNVNMKTNTHFTLNLRDMAGRLILSSELDGTTGENYYEMDLNLFEKGIYMLEAFSFNERWNTKVIIE